MGNETPPVMAQNQRVKEFMNYQITEVMKEYDPEMDSLLFYLPLAGSAFKKVYYDNLLGRPTSRLVKAEDMVVSYETTDLESSPRFTHVISITGNDLKKSQLNIEIFGRGFAWLDTGTYESLIDASNFIHVAEKRQGLQIACIEEIAYNNGWITKKILKKLAKDNSNTDYGKYLQNILNNK